MQAHNIKIHGFILLFLICIGRKLSGQDKIRTTPLDYDSSRVEVVTTRLDEEGNWLTETNGYTQLATGLNYLSDEANGTWSPTVEQIEIVGKGAAALRSPHKVYFAPTLDDPQGSVDVVGSDGARFRSAVLSLGYFDPLSGRRVTLGIVKDVPGELLPPNQVIYRDAFEATVPDTQLVCDIVYTFRKSGLEQDLVIRKIPPLPDDFELPPETCRLEVLTEFFEAPVPRKSTKLLATVEDETLRGQIAEPDWEDELLDFGTLVIGDGMAFRLGEQPDPVGGAPGSRALSKRWIEDAEGGRRILVESVDFMEIVPLLFELLPNDAALHRDPRYETILARSRARTSWTERFKAGVNPSRSYASSSWRLPSRRTGTMPREQRPMALAATPLQATPGVVLDYRMLAVNTTNHTFRGDETYLIDAMINLSGKTTLEGGSVIKFARWPGYEPLMQINVYGPFECATSAYRPAVFTACDDQSVGQWITNSAAVPDPAQIYANSAFHFLGDPSAVTIEHIRMRYAYVGILFNGRAGTMRHAQFQMCNYPFWAYGPSAVQAQNMLAFDVKPGGAAFWIRNYAHLTAEHVTVFKSPRLVTNELTATITLRNSLLAGNTTNETYIGKTESGYGNAELENTSGLFQAEGAGNYYLAAGSEHRDAGVTTINSALATDLAAMTTYPPVVLSSHFTSNTILNPRQIRDDDLPDRGYHYPTLDYCLTTLTLTNCTLLLTNGVAVGLYGPKGITLRSNSKLLSEGAPASMNRLVRYNTVQEQPTNWGNAPTNLFSMLEITAPNSILPSIDLRFTEITHLAITTNSTSARRFLQAGTGQLVRRLALSHCHLRGVNIDITYATFDTQAVGLTNNIFEGCVSSFFEATGDFAFPLNAYNNLFFRGKITFGNQDANALWTIKDNLFDVDVVDIFGAGNLQVSHNGFRSGLASFGTSAKTGLVPDYVSGVLGRFYYPPTGISGSLTNLVNTGSRLASAAGLYHFTVSADQQKETNSTVDIGFHYPAMGPSRHGLVGYWKLDDAAGTLAQDSSENAFHGTLVNGPTWTTGQLNGAVEFDGANDVVNVPDHPALRLTNGFTVAFWVRKSSEATNYVRLVGKGASNARNYGVWDDTGASGKILFQFQDAAGQYPQIVSTQQAPTGVWTHVACTWERGIGRIYLNGKLDVEAALTGEPRTSTDALTFGHAGAHLPLPGRLDEVAIYCRVLSAAEIPALMNGYCEDSDGDGVLDIAEDPNGNGTVDQGEGNWQAAGDFGFNVIITRPKNPGVLP